VLEIPISRLDADILDAVVEAFIFREGTDYGEYEISLEEKKSQVKEDIRRGKVVIIFDEESESCNLMTRQKYQQLSLGA
jgi:hypothetical protein